MRVRSLGGGLALLLMVMMGAAAAGAAVGMEAELPPHHPLVAAELGDFRLVSPSAAAAESRIVDVADAHGFTQAIRAQTNRRASNEYDVQLVLPMAAHLARGDVVWIGFWARTLSSGDESGQGLISVVLEQTRQPYGKLLQQRIGVGQRWEQFAFAVRVASDAAGGSLHLALRLGAGAQVVEVGGPQLLAMDDPAAVRVADLPQTRLSYGGRESGAAWRAAAEQRIEQIRKAPLTVRVVDAGGAPVAGAAVAIEMQQHAFPFGCVYDPSLIAGPAAGTAAARDYAGHFVDWFNVGVDEHAMKWPDWERPGDRTLALDAVEWMTHHGIRVRGHCLVWPGWSHLPADVQKLKGDPAALERRVEDHIRDEVGAFAGRLSEWDVINEPYVNNDLMKALGAGVMAEWFKTAHAADPSPRLLLNETAVPTNPPSDPHYDVLMQQVRQIQQDAGPIGAVGMQAHFGASLTSIDQLQQIYDRFAALGIPIEITELDIDVKDEQLQADYLRDFLTFSFSHPDISGIMLWGFVQGHHWRPDAALWRSDWSAKPAGKVWLELVKEKWWTRAQEQTSADGVASVRGFLGDYLIRARGGGKSGEVRVSLPASGRVAEVVVR